jgi:hypothetical protein
MLQITNPYPWFAGLDGKALALGYIYIGTANLDPQTNPVTVFWDAAGTQEATQPIRTIAGYPDRDGSPAQLFTAEVYSIRVRDAAGELVFYSASQSGFGTAESATPTVQDYLIHYSNAGGVDVSVFVFGHIFDRAVTLGADLPTAYFHAETPAAAVLSLKKNGTEFATATVDGAGAVTYSGPETAFAAGDRFTIYNSSTATILAGFFGTIVGTIG